MLNSFLLAVFSVSMFSLLAVSFDRFWAVCYPVTYHVSGTKTTKTVIAFCWIFGIFFGFLPTFGWNSGHFDNKCDLRVYYYFFSEKIVANSNEFIMRRKEIRAANTLAMIVGTFIVLWFPGMMSLFIIAITKNRDFPLDILQLTTILVHLNSAIDPIIYAYRMKNIRAALNKLFRCCTRSENSSNNSSSNENKVSVKTSNSSSNKSSNS